MTEGDGKSGAAAAMAGRALCLPPLPHHSPHPPPNTTTTVPCLRSLEGRAERRMIKKMEATQSSRQRRPFIYSETITSASTRTLLQTANLGSRPCLPAGSGGGGEMEAQQTSSTSPPLFRRLVGFLLENNVSDVSQSLLKNIYHRSALRLSRCSTRLSMVA